MLVMGTCGVLRKLEEDWVDELWRARRLEGDVMKGDVIEGVKPATIVHTGKISIEELEAEVRKTQEQHGSLLAEYHKVWYEASFTWPYTHFLGIGMMKCPNDLWAYQALMAS